MVSKPNILFLLIDGFRADKFTGKNKSSITPNLDKLFKQGTYFSQNIAPSPSTVPSVSSIMSSLYPHKALIKDNNLYRINMKNQFFPLEFKKNGYETFASYQDAIDFLGLDKIFDHADGYDNYTFLWKNLTEKILQKFDDNEFNEPWFYYLHVYDLHLLSFISEEREKHAPPEFFEKNLSMNQYERVISVIDSCIGKILSKIDLENTIIVVTADHGSEFGVYDEELEKINAENLERRLHTPGTGFDIAHKIATSAPGFLKPLRKKLSFTYSESIRKNNRKKMESVLNSIDEQDLSIYRKRLMKQSAWFSGDVEPTLYDDRFRIPLLFVGPKIPNGKIISSQVRSIDILPTIAELAGIPYKKDIDGTSLVSMLNGDSYDIPAFLEGAVNAPKFISKEWIGVRLPDYKYFRLKNDTVDNTPHLYDLKDDLHEEYNIADKKPEIVNKMEKILIDFLNGKSFEHDEIHESTEKETNLVEEELRKLGYV